MGFNSAFKGLSRLAETLLREKRAMVPWGRRGCSVWQHQSTSWDELPDFGNYCLQLLYMLDTWWTHYSILFEVPCL